MDTQTTIGEVPGTFESLSEMILRVAVNCVCSLTKLERPIFQPEVGSVF
jgi:hypothetical protein